jgi:hypothetical protein
LQILLIFPPSIPPPTCLNESLNIVYINFLTPNPWERSSYFVCILIYYGMATTNLVVHELVVPHLLLLLLLLGIWLELVAWVCFGRLVFSNLFIIFPRASKYPDPEDVHTFLRSSDPNIWSDFTNSILCVFYIPACRAPAGSRFQVNRQATRTMVKSPKVSGIGLVSKNSRISFNFWGFFFFWDG